MRDNIIDELLRVESEKDINLVNARERGSRMLGAEHEDSDWDVFFLFSQEPHVYATIHGRIDSIHEPHVGENEEIDLHGWNVDKFGDLVRDSNPNAIEYCREGATEYLTSEAYPNFLALSENARDNFNHMSLYHHYLSMAKHNWKKYVDSGNDCTKGRQFYVARSVAMAQGIRKGGEMPPLDARELSDYQPIDLDIRKVLAKLTEAKRVGHKDHENPDIVGPLYELESTADMDPTDERINSPDDELIDAFIRSALV